MFEALRSWSFSWCYFLVLCGCAHCRYLSKWAPHQAGNSGNVTEKLTAVLLYEIIVYLITSSNNQRDAA